MKKIVLLITILAFASVSCQQIDRKDKKKDPVDYVNNRIGNISILLVPTFPVTHLPNSMLRMIPAHTEFVTDRMQGLPLNVPSHRQGDLLYLMPYCGELTELTPNMNYRYDHEQSTPYHYSVYLDDHGILTRFAPAARSAIFSLTYENEGPRYVMLRTVGNGELFAEGNTMHGYEIYHGTKHYFYLEFDQEPIESISMLLQVQRVQNGTRHWVK